MSSACAPIRRQLNAYVDGELDPGKRLRVARHLVACEDCRGHVDALRDVGEVLRAHLGASGGGVDLSGLAPGVIARARAEQSQSWQAWLRRGVEDWHWALVGAGSLGAAVISVLIAAAVCAISPRLEREDSLAALLNNLQGPAAGRLYILATPVGPNQGPVLMEFDNGRREADYSTPESMPEGLVAPSEADLAFLLSEAVIGPDGRMTNLSAMSKRDREQTEPLLNEMQRQRNAAPRASWSMRQVNVQRLWLFTNTSVSAKAL